MNEEQRQGRERRTKERRRSVPGPPGPPGGRERRERVLGWRSRDVLRAALLIAAVYAVVRLIWFAHTILFLAFFGVLFGLVLSAGVDRLKAAGVPRALGTLSIVAVVIGLLIGLGIVLAPTLRAQTRDLRAELPAVIDRLELWLLRQQGGVVGAITGTDAAGPRSAAPPGVGTVRQPAADSLPRPSAADTVAPQAGPQQPAAGEGKVRSLRARLTAELGNMSRYLFAFLSSTIAVLGGVLMVFFIAVYIAVQPELYRTGVMHLFPHRSRPRAQIVLANIALMLRRWLITQLAAMLAIGLITTVTLLLLRVPSALALGLLAGLLEFVPIIGPIIASLPAIAMAFLDSPEKALAVALAFIVIQQAEGHLITPLFMKEGVDLPPVLTLVAQAVMAAVFGIIGLLVAVPLLAAAMIPIKLLYVEDVVGDEMSLPGDRAGTATRP